MTKNPLINALTASLYIAVVASLMFYGTKELGPADNVLAPMAMISLFTLSAAVMGYLFLSRPLQLYLDGEKQGAVNFFLKTVGAFAIITILCLLALI